MVMHLAEEHCKKEEVTVHGNICKCLTIALGAPGEGLDACSGCIICGCDWIGRPKRLLSAVAATLVLSPPTMHR